MCWDLCAGVDFRFMRLKAMRSERRGGGVFLDELTSSRLSRLWLPDSPAL